MSEAIAFFCGLIAMTIVWFVHDTKYNPYMRGEPDKAVTVEAWMEVRDD